MDKLFVIIFTDDSIFSGGNYQQTKWKEIPDKKIRSIFYRMPDGDHLILSGYEKYYHMIEVAQDIMGEKKGEVRLEFSYIMGKKDGYIRIYKINLQNNNVEVKELKEDDDYINKLNPKFWK
jgi:hypothetical protein